MFWDSFDAVVNSNVGLGGVQKFNYLHAQLHDDDAHVIAGLPFTDDNYICPLCYLAQRQIQPTI